MYPEDSIVSEKVYWVNPFLSTSGNFNLVSKKRAEALAGIAIIIIPNNRITILPMELKIAHNLFAFL